MKKIMLSACLLAFAFVSCKKDKDPVCELNQAGLVGAYKITAVKYKASVSAPEVDRPLDACEKDDFTTLNADNTYIYSDAGIVCSPNGDDNGTWGISSNTIYFDGVAAGTISNYSCTGMTVTRVEILSGETTTTTTTLVKL